MTTRPSGCRTTVEARIEIGFGARPSPLARPGLGPRGIPAFTDGGIVTKPTIALVGEAGPEMIVPLTGPKAGGGITVHVGSVVHRDADPQAVMALLAREIQKQFHGAG